MDHKAYFKDMLEEHNNLFSRVSDIASNIITAGELLIDTIKKKNKILICGNGGSASDSQHFAAELIGRFEKDRKAMPAVALTTDTSILTALGNDYGYDSIFARQVEGLANSGDTVVGISTSGNSKNVIYAIESAKKFGVRTVGLLGRDGGKLSSIVDLPVIVNHPVTARIQEVHIFILHFWSGILENYLETL